MLRRIQSQILIDYLEGAFNNGAYRKTLDDVARGIFKLKGAPTAEHIDAIRAAWQQAQKKLREVHDICVMLVSAVYFEDYPRSEPKGHEAIKMCIAGYGGRKAAGIRLMSLKDERNDPMAVAYFEMRGRNLGGQMAAVEDRITVLWKHRRLTTRMARKQVDIVTEPALPYHEAEFNDLMNE